MNCAQKRARRAKEILKLPNISQLPETRKYVGSWLLSRFCSASSRPLDAIRNQQVDGSIPPAGSSEIKGLACMADLFFCGKITDCAQIVPVILRLEVGFHSG